VQGALARQREKKKSDIADLNYSLGAGDVNWPFVEESDSSWWLQSKLGEEKSHGICRSVIMV
jgi:hypothetical protein